MGLAIAPILILNLAGQLIAFSLLEETYMLRLLQLKARKLRKVHPEQLFHTKWEKKELTLPRILRVSLSRPWIMLATQPIIQSLALYQAFNFGFLYLVISGLPTLWEENYDMKKGEPSLNYISVAAGPWLVF
ncbi:MFS multidrug transporter [Colletotrichum tofieldiae]|nr:MFS multidrug transporter [Colletotrichum tofieldiae]